MSRKLIVSADDLGLHEAINLGVVEAHQEGIVTSASMVACGPAFEHASRLVGPLPSLDLGIHLTLVEEKPLLGPEVLKTLAPQGILPRTYRHLFLQLIKGRIDPHEIELELDAQIRRVLSAGHKVSHLDSHQHTHLFPQVRPILLALAERHGIQGVRAAARVTPARTKFSLFLAPFAKAAQRDARARGLRTPDTLWLPSPSGRITASDLVHGLTKLPAGVTEVVVHPGVDQESLDRAYPDWGFDWGQDLAAIKSASVREALARYHIELSRYSELS